MFQSDKLIRELIKKITRIEKLTLESMKEGRIEQEAAITDRLFGAMEYVLNHEEIAGVEWRVKTLTERGRGSQESEFGADFLAALNISIPGYQVAKGFLAQSKLVEPSRSFSSLEFKRLKEQCEKMLFHSSASFVFLYSKQVGFSVIPATSILAARDCNPHDLISKRMNSFYKEHFECFIGDKRIQCANPEALESLRNSYEVGRAVLLSGSEPPTQRQLSLWDEQR